MLCVRLNRVSYVGFYVARKWMMRRTLYMMRSVFTWCVCGLCARCVRRNGWLRNDCEAPMLAKWEPRQRRRRRLTVATHIYRTLYDARPPLAHHSALAMAPLPPSTYPISERHIYHLHSIYEKKHHETWWWLTHTHTHIHYAPKLCYVGGQEETMATSASTDPPTPTDMICHPPPKLPHSLHTK